MKRKRNGQSLGNNSFPNMLGTSEWQSRLLSPSKEVEG